MKRRKLLQASVALFGSTSVAGCANPPSDSMKIEGFGLIKKNNDAASYITVKNVSQSQKEPEMWLAVYDNDNVRLSNWDFTSSDSVEPGASRRLWVVWEMAEEGWGDSNQIGQALQAKKTKMKLTEDSKIYDEENVGDFIPPWKL